MEYKPVCARFNQELREFGNNCELAKTKCETQQGKISYLKRNYWFNSPLINVLQLQLFSLDWQIVNQGSCSTKTNVPIAPSCPKFCTREYEPVCAEFNSEMKEFSNQCVLRQTICETNTSKLKTALNELKSVFKNIFNFFYRMGNH